MSTLAWIMTGWAVVAGMVGVLLLVIADPGAWLRGFSRNRLAAWTLTAAALGWGMWLLWHTPLGQFDALKPLAAVLTPVGYGLILFGMPELLAARALGVLFILVPAPILDAVRWHPSSWRLVVVALCYLMATSGIALVLSPFFPRKWGESMSAHPLCRRAVAVLCLMLAGWLVVLAARSADSPTGSISVPRLL